MQIVSIPPSAKLSPYIQEYWILENDLQDYEELVYPSGKLQLLFHYGKPFVKSGKNGDLQRQPQMAICGQNLEPGQVISRKNSGVIGVVFHPYAANLFLHLPIHELTELEVDVTDIFKNWKDHQNQFIESQSNRQRIQLIEGFLMKNFAIKNKIHFNIIRQSIEELNQINRSIAIRSLAKKYYVSERNFIRLYKQHVGLTPKKTADIIRFNNAVALLNQKNPITTVSYQSGYYDQAHFIKSFKQLMGMTPKTYSRLL